MKSDFQSMGRDAWVLTAIVVGVVLRIINLGDAPLWHDEIFTAVWVGSPWRDLVYDVMTDNHLPFYPVLLKAWSMVVGDSETALRMPSLIASVAAIPATAALGAVVAGNNTARVAAWVSAISPFFVHHAQEARMYSFVHVLAALSLWLLARYLRGDSKRLGAAFVLANMAMLCTHYYALFFVATELGVLFLYCVLIRPREPASWIPAAALCSLSIIAVVSLALFAPTLSAGEDYEVGLLALPGIAWAMLFGYILLPASEQLHQQGIEAVHPYAAYFAVAIIPVAFVGLAGLRRLDRHGLAVIVLVLVGVVLGPFAVSFLFPRISINPRYFVAGGPALAVLLAAGIAAGRHVAMRAAGTIVLGLMLYATVVHLANPGQKRADVYAAGVWLDGNVPADTELLVTSNEMLTIAEYHWPDRPAILFPDRKTVATSSNADQIAAVLPFDGRERAYYVLGRAWLNDPDGYLQDALERRYSQCPGTVVRGVRIMCLRKR